MTSTRDPDLMSAEERRREVAGLFAEAILRMRFRATHITPSDSPEIEESSPEGLELSDATRLSVTTG